MPVPEFLAALRRKIGNDRVLMPAVAGVIRRDDGRVLVMRRADTGEWSFVSGICEPHEAPADTMVREALEETGLEIRCDRLLCLYHTPDLRYPNGDVACYVSALFECSVLGGELETRDGEALELRFVETDELPPIRLLDWLPAPLPELFAADQTRF
ncbi:MAG: NUDIX domain-containing protein [Planctomycetes bacterium]|nr:NUDIX domain-containing protein [Planctomycetota bacterium]